MCGVDGGTICGTVEGGTGTTRVLDRRVCVDGGTWATCGVDNTENGGRAEDKVEG